MKSRQIRILSANHANLRQSDSRVLARFADFRHSRIDTIYGYWMAPNLMDMASAGHQTVFWRQYLANDQNDFISRQIYLYSDQIHFISGQNYFCFVQNYFSSAQTHFVFGANILFLARTICHPARVILFPAKTICSLVRIILFLPESNCLELIPKPYPAASFDFAQDAYVSVLG